MRCSEDGHGDGEEGIGTVSGLIASAVGVDHRLVDGSLIVGVQTNHDVVQRTVYVGDSLENAFSVKTFRVTVAEFPSLVLAGAGTGRD